MKTAIFLHFNVIEIIFALNNASGRKDNARTTSREFNEHRYVQGPPVPSARTTRRRHRLVKYFHPLQTDLRSELRRDHKHQNSALEEI
jgi:hypothetical protein